MSCPRRHAAGATATLALLAALLPSAPAAAQRPSRYDSPTLTFRVERQRDSTVILHAEGRIAPGDAARLEEAAREAGATEVWLASRGGAAIEGMQLGHTIRSLGLKTRVDGLCASACVDAFLGGVERYVDRVGTLWVHRPAIGTAGFEAKVREHGLEAALRSLEGVFLVFAHSYASFLHEMGVGLEIALAAYETPHEDMRRLTARELREWGVVTGDWDRIGDVVREGRRQLEEMWRQSEEMRRQDEEMQRQVEAGELSRAQRDLKIAEDLERLAEEMLRSPDPARRLQGERMAELAASARRRAEWELRRPPGPQK
jgi:hypothetical protein